MVTETGEPEIRDYSLPFRTFKFRLEPGGDVFESVLVPSPVALAIVAKEGRQIGTAVAAVMEADDPEAAFIEILGKIGTIFKYLLEDKSAEKFAARLIDIKKPVDIQRQLMPILTDLMEFFGLRPTQPSSLSATRPSDDGDSSTDGAPAEGSTPSI